MDFLYKKYAVLILLSVIVTSVTGCAEIDPFEAPTKVIRHPLGTESIKTGSTKEEVIKEWGKPDIINKLGTQDQTGTLREEWIYKARQYTGIPIDAGYLSKNKYLYFDGNHLTTIADEPKEK